LNLDELREEIKTVVFEAPAPNTLAVLERLKEILEHNNTNSLCWIKEGRAEAIALIMLLLCQASTVGNVAVISPKEMVYGDLWELKELFKIAYKHIYS